MKELIGSTLKEVFVNYSKMVIDGYIENDQLDSILSTFKQKQYGILIYGKPGMGKTFIFEVLHHIINPKHKLAFRKINVLDVVLNFNTNGHKCFRDYIDKDILFDDLGTEDPGIWYNDKVNVFEKMIQWRYDLWKTKKVRTYFTSNLNEQEIKDQYGLRCYSRLCEMCDRFILDRDDKRKLRNFKGFIKVQHNMKTQEDINWEKYYQAHIKKLKENPEPIVKPLTKGELMRQSIGSRISETEIQKEINKVSKQKK